MKREFIIISGSIPKGAGPLVGWLSCSFSYDSSESSHRLVYDLLSKIHTDAIHGLQGAGVSEWSLGEGVLAARHASGSRPCPPRPKAGTTPQPLSPAQLPLSKRESPGVDGWEKLKMLLLETKADGDIQKIEQQKADAERQTPHLRSG